MKGFTNWNPFVAYWHVYLAIQWSDLDFPHWDHGAVINIQYLQVLHLSSVFCISKHGLLLGIPQTYCPHQDTTYCTPLISSNKQYSLILTISLPNSNNAMTLNQNGQNGPYGHGHWYCQYDFYGYPVKLMQKLTYLCWIQPTRTFHSKVIAV